MSPTLHRTLLFPVALAAFAFPLHAATLVYSTTAPTVDGADISNFTGSATDAANVGGGDDASTYFAHDRGAIGQTFTTGSNAGGYTLSAFTFQSVAYSTFQDANNAGSTLTLRFGTFSGTALTVSNTETAATVGTEPNQPASGLPVTGNGAFITFILATPLSLAANTSYFFDMAVTGGTQYFIETNGTSTDALADSQAYHTDRLGGNFTGGTTTALFDTGDHVFHADLQAVPEPSAALLGAIGSLMIVRRRKA